MRLVLGIDPGVNGALALIDADKREIINIWDTPNYEEVLTTGKLRKSIDVEELVRIFDRIETMEAQSSGPVQVKIEKVQAFGKQSAPAAFNFGYAAAIPYALATAYSWEIELISPVAWKRYHTLQATSKDAARIKVRNAFPQHKDWFKRKLDVDRADAVLIAFYKESENVS